MELTTYEGTYQEYKTKMDRAIQKTEEGFKQVVEGFVEMGYLLKVARDTNILAESGYSTMAEFAQAEYI